MPNIPNLPIDWTSVDWRYVAVLAVFVFLSTLIGTFKRAFVGSLLSALLFAVFFVFWTYYPHNVPLPTALNVDKAPSAPAAPLAQGVTAAPGVFGGVSAEARTYPSRAINMVVPFPPGGPSDVIARIVADQMSKVLGETIVIENIGGAGAPSAAPASPRQVPTAIRFLPAAWARTSPRLRSSPVFVMIPGATSRRSD